MRVVLLTLALAAAAPAWADEATAGAPDASDADELALRLANPVAALISVPFQFNWDTGLGIDGDGDRTTLNIQPVIPMSIGGEWNLISRTIAPVIWQDDVLPGGGSQSGIGDFVQSFFFSPKAPTAGGWIWGAGPVLLLPVGNSDFTLDQWGVGPTAVALKQTPNNWTVGLLANHIWGVSNSGPFPDVDATLLQPFVSKGLGLGRTATLSSEATYDHNSSRWTVPVNASLSQILPIGGQLISIAGGVRVFLDAPPGGPDWGLRLTITLLYPR